MNYLPTAFIGLLLGLAFAVAGNAELQPSRDCITHAPTATACQQW